MSKNKFFAKINTHLIRNIELSSEQLERLDTLLDLPN